jgi:hypothetical protein
MRGGVRSHRGSLARGSLERHAESFPVKEIKSGLTYKIKSVDLMQLNVTERAKSLGGVFFFEVTVGDLMDKSAPS